MRTKGATRATLATVLSFALVALVASCGDDDGDAGAEVISVGSKNFTEQYILGELYTQALEADGFIVERRLNLGSEQITDRALQSGEIDVYPEYTGTALAAIVGYAGPAPKTPQETYERARRLYSERDPPNTMLPPARFNNSFGIAVNRKVAEKYGLRTLADLAEASPELRFATYSEFQNRSDTFPNLKQNYPALDFRETIVSNDVNLRYRELAQGNADVGVCFLTDGQIAAQNLVVMEDPKNIWPIYQPAPLVRSETLQRYPRMERVLNAVSASLDLKTMQRLNAAVDLEDEQPAEVARRHLQANGLLE